MTCQSCQSDQQTANLHLKRNKNQPSEAPLRRQSTRGTLWSGGYQATQICCFNKSGFFLGTNHWETTPMKQTDVSG